MNVTLGWEYMGKEEKCVESIIPDMYNHRTARAEPEQGRATRAFLN